MTDLAHQDRERLEELTVLKVTEGLTTEQHRELLGLLDRLGVRADHHEQEVDRLHFILASIDAGWHDPDPTVFPEHLRRRLEDEAERFLREQRAPGGAAGRIGPGRPPHVVGFWTWSGWLAAAASLGIAVLGWWPRVEPSVERRLEEFIHEASDELHLNLEPGPHAAGADVRGHVVWSHEKQHGFAHLSALPPIDPEREDFQIWVIDATRPADRAAISAGVFECPASDQPYVFELRVAVPVGRVTTIAITVEPQGGAMESVTDRVVALATLQ